jgi:hypothetical protein
MTGDTLHWIILVLQILTLLAVFFAPRFYGPRA